MRPGEKHFEELGTAEERVAKTHHLKIFIGKIAAYPEGKIQQALNHLSVLAKQGKEIELRRYLSELLPEANLAGVDAESLQSPPHELNEAQLGHRHPVPAFLN
jgi:FlaA1/EpsC-like NDP-sugar epimerase